MLQDGVDPLHPVAGVLGVVIRHNGFEDLAPMQGAGQLFVSAGFLDIDLPSGLVHPQF